MPLASAAMRASQRSMSALSIFFAAMAGQVLGVSGAWAFYLKPKDGGTELTMTYHVGGARDFVTTLAPNVDTVMGEGYSRLTRYAETGTPQ